MYLLFVTRVASEVNTMTLAVGLELSGTCEELHAAYIQYSSSFLLTE
jgi:hypothetical protein